MKTKLLRIIRENFDVKYDNKMPDSYWILSRDKSGVLIGNDDTFNVIVKMLECIYPQGRHYAIMRHSRRFKQAKREKTMRALEIASISLVVLAIITVLILNTCCGSGIQY